MADRTPCQAPFCRRTIATGTLAAQGHTEWLCQNHWRLVPARLKRRKRKLTMMLRRRNDHQDRQRIWDLLIKCWSDCKREAIERTAGI